MNNAETWAAYAAAIAQGAGLPAAPKNLILTGTSEIANFATGSSALPSVPKKAEALYETYDLGNTQLNPTFVYDEAADSNFFSDYATYVDNLVPKGAKPPSPSDTAKIKLIKTNLSTAQATLDKNQTAAFAAYNAQVKMFPNKYKDFSDFLRQSTWGATLNGDISQVRGFNSQLSTLYSNIYGKSYVAINLAKNTVDTIRTDMLGSHASPPLEMLVDSGAVDMVVPTYNPGDLSTFSSWVDGIIAAHKPTDPSKQNISNSYKASSSSVDYSKNTYYSHTAFSGGFWFFRASGSVTHSGTSTVVDTSSSSFEVTFGFDGITQVDISRGNWFDSSLMYNYKSELVVPTKLIVAMYPQIKVTMDKADYASAYSAYNSSSGFGAGLWFVSASTQNSESSVNMNAIWDAESSSVTISPRDVNPVIVGMLVTPV